MSLFSNSRSRFNPGKGRLPRAVYFLTAAAIFVRVIGIDFGLAESANWNPDEIISKTDPMIPSLNPGWFGYGSFYIYVLLVKDLILYGSANLIYGEALDGDFHDFLEKFTYLRFIVGRMLTAVLGGITVPVVYKVALGLGAAPFSSLVAAALMLLFPLHILHSHYATVDVPLTLAMLLSALFALKTLDSERVLEFLLSGLLAGIATSIKYSGAVSLIFPLAAFLILEEGQKKKILLVSVFLGFLAGFPGTSPFILADWSRFKADFLFEVSDKLHGDGGMHFLPGINGFSSLVFHWTGIFSLIMAVFGSVSLSLKTPRKLLIILSFLASYFLVAGSSLAVVPRYLIPLFPFLLILAGEGIGRLAGLITLTIENRYTDRRRSTGKILTAILVATAFFTCLKSEELVRVLRVFSRMDTRVRAAGWVDDSLSPGMAVLVESNYQHGPSVSREKFRVLAYEEDSKGIRVKEEKEGCSECFEKKLDAAALEEEIASLPAEYIILTSDWDERSLNRMFGSMEEFVPEAHFRADPENLRLHFHNPEIIIYSTADLKEWRLERARLLKGPVLELQQTFPPSDTSALTGAVGGAEIPNLE